MPPLARAFVQISPDLRTFSRDAEQGIAKSKLGESGRKHGRLFGRGFGTSAAAALGGAFAVLGGVSLFSDMIHEATDARRANRLVAAAIKSTGGAANVTRAHVAKLTAAIGRNAGIDDDVVKAGTAMLLTFRNVRDETGKGNAIFDRANRILVDMTAALHGGEVSEEGLRKQAIQLGKALNDPVKGMSALARVGVTFSESQKTQITRLVDNGRALAAQKVILRELGKEFAGAAHASADPMQRLRTGIANVEEGIGQALLPVINRLVTLANRRLVPVLLTFGTWLQARGLPLLREWGTRVMPAVAVAAGTLAAGARAMATGFTRLPGPAKIAAGAVIALGIAMRLAAVANPWLLLATVIVAAVGLIVQHWGTLSRVTASVWGSITRTVMGFLAGPVAMARRVMAAFAVFWAAHGAEIKQVWSVVWAVVTRVFRLWWSLFSTEFRVALKLVTIMWRTAWAVVRAVAQAAFNIITTVVRAGLTVIRDVIALVLDVITGHWGRAWNSLKQLARDALVGAKNVIVAVFANAGRLLYSAGRAVITGLLSGIGAVMSGIGTWVRDHIVDPVVNAVKHFFGISSPSTVFAEIGGHMITGLLSGIIAANPVAAVTKVFGSMPAALGGMINKGFVSLSGVPGWALKQLEKVPGWISKGWGWMKELLGGGTGGPVSAGAAAAMRFAQSIMSGFGWGQDQFPPLRALWMGESGWNRLAQNPSSGAYGIPQALPPGKMGAAANPPMSSAAAQIRWGMSYIRSVYGTPGGAYSAWLGRSPHWYGEGLAGGIFRRPTLIGVGERGAERVDITPATAISAQAHSAKRLERLLITLIGAVERNAGQTAAGLASALDRGARRAVYGGMYSAG